MMPGAWSEFDEILSLSALNADLYREVDKHFSSAFMPMLVAGGLAVALPKELTDNPPMPELDGECLAIDVGSVKLALYRGLGRNGSDLFSVQLFSNQNQGTIGMAFYTTPQGLEVEYTSMTPRRGPDRFMIKLAGTAGHPLKVILDKLYHPVRREYDKMNKRFIGYI
jgi:hypothetical protein